MSLFSQYPRVVTITATEPNRLMTKFHCKAFISFLKFSSTLMLTAHSNVSRKTYTSAFVLSGTGVCECVHVYPYQDKKKLLKRNGDHGACLRNETFRPFFHYLKPFKNHWLVSKLHMEPLWAFQVCWDIAVLSNVCKGNSRSCRHLFFSPQ